MNKAELLKQLWEQCSFDEIIDAGFEYNKCSGEKLINAAAEFENPETVFERLTKYNDITSICLTFEDGVETNNS